MQPSHSLQFDVLSIAVSHQFHHIVFSLLGIWLPLYVPADTGIELMDFVLQEQEHHSLAQRVIHIEILVYLGYCVVYVQDDLSAHSLYLLAVVG